MNSHETENEQEQWMEEIIADEEKRWRSMNIRFYIQTWLHHKYYNDVITYVEEYRPTS